MIVELFMVAATLDLEVGRMRRERVDMPINEQNVSPVGMDKRIA